MHSDTFNIQKPTPPRIREVEQYSNKPLILAWFVFVVLMSFLFCITTQAQTKKDIYNYVLRTSIKHPKIVTAQIYYETAHLNSNVFKSNSNCFGMKLAKQRPTLAIGKKGDYAEYKSWKQSIRDYEIWQRSYYKGGDYYEFLNNAGYSTNKDYCITLKQIKI